MAYRKVCDAQTGPLEREGLRCSGSLELDWDLDKEELQEAGPSSDCTQMQHGDCQRSGQTSTAMFIGLQIPFCNYDGLSSNSATI